MRPLHGLALFAAFAAAPLSAAATQGSTMAQDDWVQTSAIKWSVQAIDWNATGSTAPAPGGEHEIEYHVIGGKSPPPSGPGALSSTPRKPSAAKEMDRPTSKLAQFAINGNSPGPCRVGASYPTMRLDDGRKRWTLSSVSVVACGDGGMTVSYKNRAMAPAR